MAAEEQGKPTARKGAPGHITRARNQHWKELRRRQIDQAEVTLEERDGRVFTVRRLAPIEES